MKLSRWDLGHLQWVQNKFWSRLQFLRFLWDKENPKVTMKSRVCSFVPIKWQYGNSVGIVCMRIFFCSSFSKSFFNFCLFVYECKKQTTVGNKACNLFKQCCQMRQSPAQTRYFLSKSQENILCNIRSQIREQMSGPEIS